MNKIIILALTTFCLVYLTGCTNTDSKQRITLFEAFERTEEIALEWSSDAELVHITSVDGPEIKDIGYGGKRFSWTAIFHSVSLNESIVLSIKNNKINTLAKTSEKIGRDQLINKTVNILNSDSALEFAKKNYNLQPGTRWAQGYNYTLYRQNEQTILCVYGEDTSGYYSKISFDFNSGECLFAEHQVPTGGGFWNNTKSLINEVWVTGADFSPNYIRDSTIAVQCIENPLTSMSTSKLKVSTDNGITWRDYLFKNLLIKVKLSENYNSNKTLYIITANSFYKLIEGQLYKIKSFNGIIDADIKEDKIIILVKEYLYVSDDLGLNWTVTQTPDDDILSVKIGVEDNIFVRKFPKDILQYKNNSWENINQPLYNFDDFDVINDKIIGYIDDNIAIYDVLKSQWTVIESPIFINRICYSQNNFFIIGNTDIYTLNSGQNNLQKYSVIPPFPAEEINKIFYISGKYFFIAVQGYSWKEINEY